MTEAKEDLYPVRIFISSTSVNYEIKQEQQRCIFILESKKIPFETVDVAKSKAKARVMRLTAGDSAANPPRFFKGELYLGGFKEFIEAVDSGDLEVWLRLKTEDSSKKEDKKEDEKYQNPKSYEHLKRRLDSAIKEVESKVTTFDPDEPGE